MSEKHGVELNNERIEFGIKSISKTRLWIALYCNVFYLLFTTQNILEIKQNIDY